MPGRDIATDGLTEVARQPSRLPCGIGLLSGEKVRRYSTPARLYIARHARKTSR